MVNNTQIKKYKDELSIRISVDKNISFHRAVFHSLDCPVNLHFWWGESEKVLAITGADKPTNLSVSVSNCLHNSTSGPKICNIIETFPYPF